MTKFTKEDLQIILLDMNAYINRTTILAESPSHKILRDKIESMIDDYDKPLTIQPVIHPHGFRGLTEEEC